MSKQSARKRKNTNQMIWWVAGIAVIVVGGLVAISQKGTGSSAAVAPITVKSDAVMHADKNVLGSPKARVQVVEYGDYL